MTCHWAGQMVSAAAVLLLVLAVLHFAIRDGKTKSGISLSMIGIAILMLLIPGRLIGICAMEGMRCVSLLLPWTVGLSVCTILAAAADLVSCYSRMNREAHSRA